MEPSTICHFYANVIADNRITIPAQITKILKLRKDDLVEATVKKVQVDK